MARLLAVDGNSLGHRSWHALKSAPRSGRGPWVTHGFVRMLATAWMQGPFDAVVVAFDSRESIRKERWPSYKANRDDHDPRLYEQLDRLCELLTTGGLWTLKEPGYEADDLLAATTGAACRADVACAVLSSDRDLIALVDETVTLLRPRRTMADLGVYDPAAVRDEFGVAPSAYLQLAALRGDRSDGLDGVTGIGAKTAARLIRAWGSVEALYDDIRHLPPDLARALRNDRDKVERNLQAMAPLGDHDIDLEGCLQRGLDLDRITTTLLDAGLDGAAAAFRAAVERGPLPPAGPPPERDTNDFSRGLNRPPARTRPRPAAVTGTQVGLFD